MIISRSICVAAHSLPTLTWIHPSLLCKWSEVAQSCPTLWDPMDCSLPGSSVHGIFQAIVLEWNAISFSSGSSQPRDWTWVSRIVDRRFTIWATREVLLLCEQYPSLLHTCIHVCMQTAPGMVLFLPGSFTPFHFTLCSRRNLFLL